MSIDKNIGKSKEQQHSEGRGEKRTTGHSSSSSGSSHQLDLINAELAKSNLTDSARKALLEKKKKLEGR